MRTSLKILLGFSGVLALTGAAQAAPQLVPIIPFPGATTTTVFGIANDNNTIAGSYVDSDGVSHGFYGTLDGNYTSFDFPGADTTQARAISGNGMIITGFSNIADAHCSFPEWEMKVGGPIKQITKDEVPLFGIAMGIASTGDVAGDYCDDSGIIHGQIARHYKWTEDVTTPFDSPYTGERAVNADGTIVGFYVDSNTGLQIGTIIQNGVTSAITYPDPSESYTVFEGLNADGHAAGQWGDTSGLVHSFAYNIKKAKFTEIDDPLAASFTQAWGVNKDGLIAVTSDAGAYIYCQHPNQVCVTVPGAKPVTLHPHEISISPKTLLAYGDGHKGNVHAPVKQTLPKGASMQ